LLERRPDLIAAERRLEASDARWAQARASLYPRISLTASGGTRTRELADLVSSDFSVWTLAANLAQPIFEGGRLRAGVDLAKARSGEAAAQYSGAVLRAFMEVESALRAEQLLAEREGHLEKATREAQAALRLARQRYASGLEDFVTVLEAQRRVLEAEGQLISVRRLRLDTRVDLHLALGGGFGSR
jgi:outer membrane protein, multidrug efflux system